MCMFACAWHIIPFRLAITIIIVPPIGTGLLNYKQACERTGCLLIEEKYIIWRNVIETSCFEKEKLLLDPFSAAVVQLCT